MTNQLDKPEFDDSPMEDGDEIETEVDMGQIMLRPDGYHWQAADGKQEFGPFETLDLAFADMQAADDETSEPGESLEEAEGEIGISDWIDPDTGEPAEGQSTPRLHDE
jgi:hydroxypyruvate isomerase